MSCGNAENELPIIKDVIIENDNIKKEQDLSDYFTTTTIIVSGENKHEYPPMVITFDFFEGILYLVSRQPKSEITAMEQDGTIKWKVEAQENSFSGFTTLDGYFLDRDSKIIKIYDDQKNRIFSYDLQGKLQNVEKGLGLDINDFYILSNENRLYSVSAYKNDFEEGKKAALVAYSKSNEQSFPDTIILYNGLYDSNRIPFKDYDDFFVTKSGRLFYQRDFSDTIYQINNFTATTYMKFSFSENDRRLEVQSTSSSNPLLMQQFLDENIPYSSFVAPEGKFFLASYVYNAKSIFTMIDLESKRTLINTQRFTCNGKRFSGRLDYNNGILMNQMYVEDYYQINTKPKSLDKTTLDVEDIVYTILIPKW
jgi:hypothetical protein